MDYAAKRRLKIYGHAKTVPADDPRLPVTEGLTPECGILVGVEGVDWNCPQHIPQRLTLEELEPFVAPVREERDRLRAELAAIKAQRTTQKGD